MFQSYQSDANVHPKCWRQHLHKCEELYVGLWRTAVGSRSTRTVGVSVWCQRELAVPYIQVNMTLIIICFEVLKLDHWNSYYLRQLECRGIDFIFRGNTIPMEYNVMDRIVKVGEGLYRYDNRGLVVQNAREERFHYNAKGLLVTYFCK